MARVYLEEKHLEDIAAAIRIKAYMPGVTFKPSEMAAAIDKMAASQSIGDATLEHGIITGTGCTELTTEHLKIINQETAEGISCIESLEIINLPNVDAIGFEWYEGEPVISENSTSSVDICYFENLPALREIHFPKLVNPYEKYKDTGLASTGIYANVVIQDCPALTEIDIPLAEHFPGVRRCSSLERLDLPASVQGFAFANTAMTSPFQCVDGDQMGVLEGCPSFTTLILRSPTMIKMFYRHSISSINDYFGADCALFRDNCYVYVPADLVESYTSRYGTLENGTIKFRAIEDYPEICGEVSA